MGMYDPTHNTIALFVVHLACSICYALLGVDIGQYHVPLLPYNRHIFLDWDTSSLQLFCNYRHLATSILHLIKTPLEYVNIPTLTYLTKYHSLDHLQAKISHYEVDSVKLAML
eukprot:364654-Ditylum_brightwellii.AAC.1